ncbi:hypothetical protein BMF77_pb00029 (plasmid) [Dolichospermum sp. UHCC 0315A]|uniref:DUF3854 domain-containing protein n=2 Tax=Dolichospermum sp. UHCC 0315A TaxID=1914871 RepID=UPI00125655E2|nr:hypothetical protein BMF77_04912 [Dolichospermum sp. UHCC 0315A]QEI44427.1 hypothetical protein BMF77_pb00029 [Dolichospermum sp. UHCC 0315A]
MLNNKDLTSVNQSPVPQHPEQQANSQTSASQNHLEQQANSQSPVHLPNNLTEAEYHELAISSAIHPELIERNFIHIAGDTVLNYLFISNAIPRLNTGRVTSPFLKLYQYATEGGIWISGLDPLNNWQSMEWGRFKPTQGRIDKNGKIVKYESPPKTPNRVTYFDVPDCIWDNVAARYNIKRDYSPPAQRLQDQLNPLSFWETPVLFWALVLLLWSNNKQQTEIAETPFSLWKWLVMLLSKKKQQTETVATPLSFGEWVLLLLSNNQQQTEIAETPLSFWKWVVRLLSNNQQQTEIVETPLSFWEWVMMHPEIPIILCEGEKKAASLLSQGFVAIALPGIWSGRIGKKDFDERLHPDIMPLAQPGRKFIILFDYETKSKTRWSIFQATLRTGKTIEAVGCTCEVALLPGPEKGVDDFIVERSKLIESGQTVKYSQFIEQNRTNTPNQAINQTLLIEGNQLDNDGQIVECPHVLNQFLPVQENQLTDNYQAIKCHQTANQNSLVDNNKLTNDGQFTEQHEVINQNSSVQITQINALLTIIIDDAVSLKQYQRLFHTRHRGLSSKYKPDIRVNVKFLSSAEKLPKSGLVVLSSDMGTNKTGRMAQWREANPDVKFLNTGHRVNLLKNLATRLKTDMYSDLSYAGLAKAQALSITIDSLHKLNTQMLNYGCVFIDEACQYLTHLLHSKTCKEYRAQILEVLEYIVYNAPLVIIADAHMDDITVEFFRAMRPPEEKPFILKNDWRNGDRLIYWYEGNNSSAIVAQISAALMNKQKIMVASDSKRFIKKLEQSLTMKVRIEEAGSREQVAGEQGSRGAEGLDTFTVVKDGATQTLSQVNSALSATDKNENSQILQVNSTSSNHSPTPDTQHHSDLEVNAQSNTNAHKSTTSRLRLWSIHSDNSGSEENVAFIKDITNAVKDVDALLTSPSLGTGVDINEYHFDVVYGIFHAKSQTATECAQQLYRYRPHVPIHVWVAPRPPFGYQETNAQKIKERILQTNEVTAFLIRIDKETGRRGVEKDWALDTYCQILAARNRSINNLRTDLQDLLTEMGNKIISMGGDEDTFALDQMKKAAAALDTAYYSAVTRAKNISPTEYRQRQNKDYLKPEEVFECEKFRLQDTYGIEVTESLVEKDAGGKLSRAISAFEAILKEPDGTIFDTNSNRQYPAPPTIVAEKDRQEREHLPLCMDWGNYSAKWLARFNLGLHHILKRLVAGEEVTARDPDLLRMVALAKEYGVYIKTILGFTVPDKCQPIWLLGTLLDQLGLKLDDRKEGPRGKQVKLFFLSPGELDFALQVIAHREHKRNMKQERAQQAQESQRHYQAGMQSRYGVAPPPNPVSTPPPNGIGKPLGEGVNTTVDLVDFAACSRDGNNPSLVNGADGVDFRQFQPDDGDNTSLVNCVELLRASLKKGVEAIKSVLRSWSEDRRWGAVLLLEDIAAQELRSLEQLMPQFYDWLSESVLPMDC